MMMVPNVFREGGPQRHLGGRRGDLGDLGELRLNDGDAVLPFQQGLQALLDGVAHLES